MRLLVVKFSSIGDCVMAVPVASRVRRADPSAYIGWAVDPRCAAVLSADANSEPKRPLLDLRYEVPWERWKREHAGTLTHIRHFLKLREYKFDVGIDLQGHAKTAICLRLSGAKRRIASRALDPMARILNSVAPHRGAVHTVERNLETLNEVFASGADASPVMPALLSIETPPNLATIAVGTGHPKKNYRQWGAVAHLLLERGLKVVFLGGPGESAPSGGSAALDLVGKLSLEETMAWVASSRVHLAADTGTGHIAAAYGVPVVSVFGWTDPAVYRPYTSKAIVLDAGINMDGVDPEQVVEAACGF